MHDVKMGAFVSGFNYLKIKIVDVEQLVRVNIILKYYTTKWQDLYFTVKSHITYSTPSFSFKIPF